MIKQKGFSFIEFLAAVAVVGILIILVLMVVDNDKEDTPYVNNTSEESTQETNTPSDGGSVNTANSAKTRDQKRVSDLEKIAGALDKYHDEYGFYPRGRAGSNIAKFWNDVLGVLVTKGYLSGLPVDPKNDTTSNCPGCSCMRIYMYRSLDGSSYELAAVQEEKGIAGCKDSCGIWQEGEPWQSEFHYCISSN